MGTTVRGAQLDDRRPDDRRPDDRRPAPGLRRLASPAISGLLRRRVAELCGLALALGGVALLLALGSHDAADPSLDVATARRAANLLGLPGAYASDVLLQGVGLAGVLPAMAMLAWAWRIASRRGVGSLAMRLLCLVLALPVLGAALAAVPLLLRGAGMGAGVGAAGMAADWPSSAGLGGALGGLLAGAGLAAGRDLLGPAGGDVMAALAAGLALVLVVLAFGLSRREWQSAGLVARSVAQGGGRAAGASGRLGGRIGAACVRLLDRLNGVRREPPPNVIQPEEGRLRRQPATPAPVAAPWREAPPKQRVAPTVTAAARKQAAAKQEALPLDGGPWRFPPLSLLTPAPARARPGAPSREALQANARLLESVLADYGVQGRIVEIRPGPVVTLYELEPAPGIRSARVIGLADDVARSLSVTAVRIATVPGRNVIGIEVPNAKRETVYLSELMGTDDWDQAAIPPGAGAGQGHRRRAR